MSRASWMRNHRLLPVLVLTVVLLAAGVAGASDKIHLIWAYPWLTDAQEERGQVAINLVNDFNAANPDIEVEVVAITNYRNALPVQVAAGAPPDIFMSPESGFIGQFGPEVLVDLGDALARRGRYDEVVSDLFPALLPGMTVQGRLLGLPISTEVAGLYYYNVALFQESGLTEPQEGWRWDDLTQMAQRLVRRDGDGNTLTWGITRQATLFERNAVVQNGASQFSEDGREWLPNVELTVEAWQWAADLMHRYQVMPPASNANSFVQGQAGFRHDGSFRLPVILTAPFEVRVAPPLSQRQPAASANPQVFYGFRSGDAAKDDAIARFIMWITDTDQSARWLEAWRNLAASRSVLIHPVYVDTQRGLGEQMSPTLPHMWDYAWHPMFAQVRATAFDPYVNRIWANDMPVPVAVEQAKREGQIQVDEYFQRLESSR